MRRLTVTVDDDLFERARRDVSAGRAESVSAWVTDAMRKKAQALEELLADIDALNREDPPTEEDIAAVARSLGKSKKWVDQRLHPRPRK